MDRAKSMDRAEFAKYCAYLCENLGLRELKHTAIEVWFGIFGKIELDLAYKMAELYLQNEQRALKMPAELLKYKPQGSRSAIREDVFDRYTRSDKCHICGNHGGVFIDKQIHLLIYQVWQKCICEWGEPQKYPADLVTVNVEELKNYVKINEFVYKFPKRDVTKHDNIPKIKNKFEQLMFKFS